MLALHEQAKHAAAHLITDRDLFARHGEQTRAIGVAAANKPTAREEIVPN